MKFLLKTPIDTLSGYGNDGVGLAQALTAAGHDVHLMATSIVPPIPPDVAQLFTKWPHPPFDAVIVHQSPGALEAKVLRDSTSRLIGWTMWENTKFRFPGWEEVKDQLAETNFDLLLAYDEITEQAMADPEVNPGIPVRKLQGGYQPDFWLEANPTRRYDRPEPFQFGMVGRLDRRKNPWAAVRAFGRLKDRLGDSFNAELHLKTTIANYLPSNLSERWPGIHVHLEWWSHLRLREFYESIHCLLAPSTGEGKNVPALEAMTTGCPVIATDWGGHLGWIGSDWAYKLRWEPYEWPEGPSTKPDEDHLEELMLHVYENRSEARRKGELARRTIPPSMSWASVVHKLENVVNSWPLGERRRDGDGDPASVRPQPPAAPRRAAPVG